ncbi:MAG: hypothetical protein O7B25_08015, partial [Gammaproteobacteria bacterium]|nr:hypothetical protein [Gammaproteobacteria bacterium]
MAKPATSKARKPRTQASASTRASTYSGEYPATAPNESYFVARLADAARLESVAAPATIESLTESLAAYLA